MSLPAAANDLLLDADGQTLESSKIVQTSQGPIQGFQYRLANGNWSELFLGIPFAKPPIGDLRFEKPEPMDSWVELFKAVKFGPAAIPLDPEAAQPCSEDCLYLNVFRPIVENSQPAAAALPVMFYIHGGGFCSGSTREYGFKGWAENFMPEGVILVTIQYRLGPFGFLSFGNGTAQPGNLGIWDMAIALRFVHENIAHFGGDPQRITVAGLSAGGAAAAIMGLSPYTRDMVHATVEMSGTAWAEWSASEQTVAAGREFAQRALGLGSALDSLDADWEAFDMPSSQIIKERLKELSVDEILKVAHEMGTARKEPNLLVWTPRIDGDFLPKDFPELVRDLPNPKPALMGLTEKEAIYFTIQDKDKFLNPFGIPRQQLELFGAENFYEFVRNVVLGKHVAKYLMKTMGEKTPLLVDAMTEDICKFYVGARTSDSEDCYGVQQQNGERTNGFGVHGKKAAENGNTIITIKQNKNFYLDQYTRLISDLLFNVPLFWMVRQRHKCQQPIFLYLNHYFNDEQFEQWVPMRGATHGNEYPYINGLFPVGEFTFNQEDLKHQRLLVKMLADFVKRGIPFANNSGSFKADDEDGKIYNFFLFRQERKSAADVSVKTMERSCHFWAEFTRRYGFNLIRGIPCDAIE